MPCSPSISLRVAASSWSLPFMNLAAKSSMFLPSVTSVTLLARVASSFSSAGGMGRGESCASTTRAPAAHPAAIKTKAHPNFRVRIVLFPRAAVPCRQPFVHLIQCMLCNAQSGHHLAARLFATTPILFPLYLPPRQAAEQRRNHQRGGQPQPHHLIPVPPRHLAPAACRHHLLLQPRRSGPTYQRLLQ